MPARPLSELPPSSWPNNAEPELTQGDVSLGGGGVSATFADRASLPPGFSIDGPAVIEEPTATVLAPPGWRATVLESGDLMIEEIGP